MPIGTKFTRREVAARNTRENATVIIDNVVYDVSEFLNDHPGGPDILLKYAGKDASEYFHEVRHSDIAINWRKELVIGEVADEDVWEIRPRPPTPNWVRKPTMEDYITQMGPKTLFVVFLQVFLYYYLKWTEEDIEKT